MGGFVQADNSAADFGERFGRDKAGDGKGECGFNHVLIDHNLSPTKTNNLNDRGHHIFVSGADNDYVV